MFNFCAFSYTLAYWDWPQWERMIDWMALHGVNMPLSVTGQEAVWYKVYRDLGLTDKHCQERVFEGLSHLILPRQEDRTTPDSTVTRNRCNLA